MTTETTAEQISLGQIDETTPVGPLSFLRSFARVVGAAAKPDAQGVRAVSAHVLLERLGSTARLTATNGHCLVSVSDCTTGNMFSGTQQVILQRPLVDALAKGSIRPDEIVEIAADGDSVRAGLENGMAISADSVVLKYPDYRSLAKIPERATSVEVSVGALITAIKTLHAVCPAGRVTLYLDGKAKMLKLVASTDDAGCVAVVAGAEIVEFSAAAAPDEAPEEGGDGE